MSKTPSPRGKSLSHSTQVMINQKLWSKILFGMIAGVAIGLIISPEGMGLWEKDWAYAAGEWLALPGVIFLGLTQMVIIPLIVCSIILGIAESGDHQPLPRASGDERLFLDLRRSA